MPGSSRMPISLRESLNSVKRSRPSNPWQVINLDLLRNIVFFLFVLRLVRRTFWKLKGRGLLGTIAELYTDTRRILYGYFLRAPGVRSQVRKQVNESLAKVQAKMIPAGGSRYLALPKEGWTDEALRTELEALAAMDHTRWEDGFVSGAVYHGEDGLLKLQTEAYGKFTVANPIHPDVFPGVRKMEAEVVAMVLSLFHATSQGGSSC
ncbi:Uu.00g137300.m01.CDS01 [Anthostomella pinea]|uniref:Uu.00g137300.m01.CDS01 n=1 Tax=Anthostomella pinea TaxID=933095 RepID=A0AAI8YL41_9PEZI|nr:Uu.00g137300.m01.CDS01 [Anthostomella pinea]